MIQELSSLVNRLSRRISGKCVFTNKSITKVGRIDKNSGIISKLFMKNVKKASTKIALGLVIKRLSLIGTEPTNA